MVKKLAIDWDERELRLVAAQCSGKSVKVTRAMVVPVGENGVRETLKSLVKQHDLEGTETLMAIGRGRAELRELQLPPVPDDELPDMVRFQAIRNFASAGESATVDYLVTNRTENGVELIAAAVAPNDLTDIRKTCEGAGLVIKRIALRPLAAAALYLDKQPSGRGSDRVLVDLLSDDAEIVIARDGRVIFVRTVRLPSSERNRGKALAGELRRSLVACGSSGSLDRVVLWGRESVHAEDVEMLADASGAEVDVLDPFTLVDVEPSVASELPEHIGRLAPLVGLLAADENLSDRLIDFLNPRERVEKTTSPYTKAAMYAVPLLVVLLLTYVIRSQLADMDQQIAELQTANEQMDPQVDLAGESVARTEAIDQFLDGNVNWLAELQRLAEQMPPPEQMIVRQISAKTDVRTGGGVLTVEGGATRPEIIESFEAALRDEFHRVSGDGASEQKSEDAYRWKFTEDIRVFPDYVRNRRYEAIAVLLSAEDSVVTETDQAAETEQADAASETDAKPEAATEASDSLPAEASSEATPPDETDSPPASEEVPAIEEVPPPTDAEVETEIDPEAIDDTDVTQSESTIETSAVTSEVQS